MYRKGYYNGHKNSLRRDLGGLSYLVCKTKSEILNIIMGMENNNT